MPTGPFPITVKLNVAAGKEVSFGETIELNVRTLCVSEIVLPASLKRPALEPGKEWKEESWTEAWKEKRNGLTELKARIAAQVEDPLYFQFLVIRPYLLGQAPIKPGDLVRITEPTDTSHPGEAYLEYSVVPPPDKKPADWVPQRKPLRGTHVFAAGQTEWITDMLKGGGPGGLSDLLFWNSKPVADERDMTQAEKDKLLKGKDGQPLPDNELNAAVTAWAKGRNDITVQVVAGYSPLFPPPDDAKRKGKDGGK